MKQTNKNWRFFQTSLLVKLQLRKGKEQELKKYKAM